MGVLEHFDFFFQGLSGPILPFSTVAIPTI
jgi:hypothetical protein